MTKIKLCGLRRECDIDYANKLSPDYIGFVFAKGSKRYIEQENAKILRSNLKKGIIPVGVFVNENVDIIVNFLSQGIIDMVQLHGSEDEAYIDRLRKLADCTIIKAFTISCKEDIVKANNSSADYVLLDSGKGSGVTFDWTLLQEIERPYFLAGGLTPFNVVEAISILNPFGVDASSSLETEGFKDKEKITAFVNAVRERMI